MALRNCHSQPLNEITDATTELKFLWDFFWGGLGVGGGALDGSKIIWKGVSL